MFTPKFPGRSIFCDILQESSPIIDYIDLGNGTRAAFYRSSGWELYNATGSIGNTNTLLPFISSQTKGIITLTTNESFVPVWCCNSDALSKIADNLSHEDSKLIPWLQTRDGIFLFFDITANKWLYPTKGEIELVLPKIGEPIEITFDVQSSGGNFNLTPSSIPPTLYKFLSRLPKRSYPGINYQLCTFKNESKSDRLKHEITRKKRGMELPKKFHLDRKERALIRKIAFFLQKKGYEVCIRNIEPDFYPFHEDNTGILWGATNDLLTLCFYLEQHPDCYLLYRTGEQSGEIIIDTDIKGGKNGIKQFVEICKKNGFDPYRTRIVLTPSGGLHFIFKYPKGYDIQTSAGKIGDGIDIRANGGIIYAPGVIRKKGPFTGRMYVVINDVTPIEYPAFLIHLTQRSKTILKKADKRNSNLNTRNKHPLHIAENLVEAARDELAIAVHKISTTVLGSRNETLYKQAFKLGCMVYEGIIVEETVISHLQLAALECGLEESEIMPTIRSAFKGAFEYKSFSTK